MVRKVAKQFHRRTGKALRLRSGLRSCEKQNELYAQGRTLPGPIVTNASGCRSWHVTGRAVDFDPYDPETGRIEKNGYHPDFLLVGKLWKDLGGEWGGDFSNLYDPGHLEWHPGLSIEEVCPVGTPCEQFRIPQNAPLWLWFLGGSVLLLGSAGTYSALKR